MKKKHLNAISALEKWLKKKEALTQGLRVTLQDLKVVIENIPEEKKEEMQSLPPPQEISGDPMAIALYADGGCRGNPGPGAFAYVLQEHSGNVLGEGVDFEVFTTNNKMELSGVIKGLTELKEILPRLGRDPLLARVKVVTDSKYVVDGSKSWVAGWKARGWKKADGKSPENLELWQHLDSLSLAFLEIDWVWVRGHVGHPQNEYCDRKANEAMDSRSA